jgi:hypothetical protein
MREHVTLEARDRPAVYRMISPGGEIVYVGKAKKLRTRLLGYFRAAYPAEKRARIVREDATIKWEYQPSGAHQIGAALRELNDALGLRDCRMDLPMYFADQTELPVATARTPGCIRRPGRAEPPAAGATRRTEQTGAGCRSIRRCLTRSSRGFPATNAGGAAGSANY